MKNRNLIRSLIIWGILITMCTIAIVLITDLASPEKVKYSDIVGYFKNEQVTEFKIVGNELTYKLKPEGDAPAEEKTFVLYSTSRFLDQVDPFITAAQEHGVLTSYDLQQASSMPLWITSIPYILMIGAVFFIGWVMLRQMSGGGKNGAMNFSKAKLRLADNEKSKVTFRDVAGADEEKEELQEIVEFLKNPTKYTKPIKYICTGEKV
ncbi:MAG: hypothetical protein IJC19_05605, partial [Clostridia bacterium]|nr:hypothetical protein [Clostridia bacterium]